MSSMIFLALVIVAVSGLIAYVGDLIGRKMGRKRLTLMGLRPKHTAIVISVSMGMLIALLTLIATFAIHKGVRDAFFTPLDQLRSDLASQKRAVQTTTDELVATRRKAQAMQGRLASESQKLQELDQRLNRSVRQLAGTRHKLSTIQGRLAAKEQQLSGVRQRLTRAQREYDRVSRDLRSSRAQLAQSQEMLSKSKELLVKVTQERLNLEDEKLQLELRRDALTQQVAEFSELSQALRQFAQGSFAPLAFASGQEILTGLVPTGNGDAARRTLLKQFIAAAERVVRQRSPEMSADTASLIFLGGTERRPARITKDEAIRSLSERIAAMTTTEQVILRLAPVNNVPVNAPALIAVHTVELFPNYQVYLAGNEVARLDLTVTEKTTTGEVLGLLVDQLLREQVPAALRAHEMVMVTRRFDPKSPNGTPEATWSTVPWAELLDTAERACALRGKVSILVRARHAANRYGPLDLGLEVVSAR